MRPLVYELLKRTRIGKDWNNHALSTALCVHDTGEIEALAPHKLLTDINQ